MLLPHSKLNFEWQLKLIVDFTTCQTSFGYLMLSAVGEYTTMMDMFKGFPFSLMTRLLSDSWQYARIFLHALV